MRVAEIFRKLPARDVDSGGGLGCLRGMLAAWLKIACALLCALALALSCAMGEAARASGAEDETNVKGVRAEKAHAALMLPARGGWGCPLALMAKTVSLRSVSALVRAWVSEKAPRRTLEARLIALAGREDAGGARPRSSPGVVRLLI